MAIRRLNRRPRSVPDWRSRFDRPYHERWYAQPGEHFERPLPGQRSRDYRRLGSPASDPFLASGTQPAGWFPLAANS